MAVFSSIFFKLVIPVAVLAVAGYIFFGYTRTDVPVPAPEDRNVALIFSASREEDSASTTESLVEDIPERQEEDEKPSPRSVTEEKEESVEAIPVSIKPSAVFIPEPFDFDPAWRDAVVNLLCTNRYGEVTNVSSGSGILIDSRGVILTNAHVAIEFLFADWPNPSLNECSVRIGSPASPYYRASLLYIPDEFVTGEIAGLYEATDKRVYGKNDYAFLVITGRTDPTAMLPESFPHLPMYIGPALPLNFPVFLIGYPASFLGGISIQRNLYLLSSPAKVNLVRAIEDIEQADIIAFGGNVIGQHGSSGGGVIGPGGVLAGLLTFFDSEYGFTTAERILNAITLGYIDRDLREDTGSSLLEFLTEGNLLSRSEYFMNNQGARYQRLYADAWREKQGVVISGVEY